MGSETKHTPGPWSLEDGDMFDTLCITATGSEGDRYEIAEMQTGFNEPFESQQQANARLIAAAPDLLDALIELKEWIENDCGAECPSDKARDAIAKAEGRT